MAWREVKTIEAEVNLKITSVMETYSMCNNRRELENVMNEGLGVHILLK